MRAVTSFLGLAYSLAVAPAGMTPQGLPGSSAPMSRRGRSISALRASGLSSTMELLESLEVLLLDQLGNRRAACRNRRPASGERQGA